MKSGKFENYHPTHTTNSLNSIDMHRFCDNACALSATSVLCPSIQFSKNYIPTQTQILVDEIRDSFARWGRGFQRVDNDKFLRNSVKQKM